MNELTDKVRRGRKKERKRGELIKKAKVVKFNDEQVDKYLKNIFFDSKHPAGFSSFSTLYQFVKREKGGQINREQIKKWLERQEVYTTNVTKKKRKHWNHRVVAPRGQYLYDVDSAVFKRGGRNKYFILAVDVFTKKLDAVAVPNLKGITTSKALAQIFERIGQPVHIRSDLGREYVAREVQTMLKERGVKHYFAYPVPKASLAERHIRTIKRDLQRRVQGKGVKDWSTVLPDAVESYNERFHRGVNMTPNQAVEHEPSEIWLERERKHFQKLPLPSPFKFNLHDAVRVSLNKSVFDKESGENFSTNLYYITDRGKPDGLPRYKVKNEENESINGSFTENELQKVVIDQNTTYRVEKILAKRVKEGVSQVKVRWMNYKPSFDSWIDEREVDTLDRAKKT